MTVRELIEALEKLDPELPMGVWRGGEESDWMEALESVEEMLLPDPGSRMAQEIRSPLVPGSRAVVL